MKRKEFWEKISNFSIAICFLAIVAKMFLREYLETIINPILFVAGIFLIVFVLSEIMMFIIKRKS